MNDVRVRDLERKWRRTGSPADEADWLRARVRADQLPQGKVELGARLGHPPCVLLCPDVRIEQGLEAWVRSLEVWRPPSGEWNGWANETFERAARASARLSFRHSSFASAPRESLARRALEALDRWILDREEHCRDEVMELAFELDAQAAGFSWHVIRRRVRKTRDALWACTAACMTAGSPAPANGTATRCVTLSARVTSGKRVREAIRAELVPWLFDRDPLRSG